MSRLRPVPNDGREDDPPPGRIVGRGRTSVVYDLGDGTVLRRATSAAADMRLEGEVMRHARRHGVPVPEVYLAQGRDLVMERVAGPTSLADLLLAPSEERVRAHARTLARLHELLDHVPPPAIPALPALGDTTTARLLHLDLHPANVVLTRDGPFLIDWTNAAAGPRAADVAMTWVVLACMSPADPAVDVPLARLRDSMVEELLATADRPALLRALPSVLEMRLADPSTSQAERVRLRQLGRTQLS